MVIWHLSRKQKHRDSRQNMKCSMSRWISLACITSLHLHVLLSLENLSHQQTKREERATAPNSDHLQMVHWLPPSHRCWGSKNPVLSALPMVPKAWAHLWNLPQSPHDMQPRWLLNHEQVLGMQQLQVNLPKMLLKDSNFSISMFYWAACHAVFPPHRQKTISLSPFCGKGSACKCCRAVFSRRFSSAHRYFIGSCQHYLFVPVWGRDLVEAW